MAKELKENVVQSKKNKFGSVSKKVTEIFEFIDEHPIPIIGQRMYYKKTSSLNSNRLNDISSKIETIDFDGLSSASSQHHFSVFKGLLYLGIGGLDECHNLVTPYSWSSFTSFGGKPVYNSKASQNASYAHALVHRSEGQYIGEFGTGWNNSSFWFGSTGKHSLFPNVSKHAYNTAINDKGFKNDKNIVKFTKSLKNNKWNPDGFLDLCELSVDKNDKILMKYCQDIINFEWKSLTMHCYQHIIKPYSTKERYNII